MTQNLESMPTPAAATRLGGTLPGAQAAHLDLGVPVTASPSATRCAPPRFGWPL